MTRTAARARGTVNGSLGLGVTSLGPGPDFLLDLVEIGVVQHPPVQWPGQSDSLHKVLTDKIIS